ncbi:MAG: tyrosine-type recombinase/integrase [Acidobacteriota bacterium]
MQGSAWIEERLARLLARAAARCPSLRARRISPHTIRRSTAMHPLQSGVDLATVVLWLGHASVETTRGYVEADLTMKERALSTTRRAGPMPPSGSAPFSRRFLSSWPSSEPPAGYRTH